MVFGKWIRRLNPRQNFKQRLGLIIATTILCFSLLLSWIVGNTSKAQIKAGNGQFMEELAYQMARNLDRGMFVYYQEIQTLATLNAIQDSRQSPESKRSLLQTLQNAYKDYAWIGLTNSDGIVLASTNRVLEGKNVSQRPWFIRGRWGAVVEDVHDAKLLAQLLPNPNSSAEPTRFVDIATPVFNAQDPNKFEGVLGAHLYWEWAKHVRDDLLNPLHDHYNVDVMVLSKSGEMLLAPASAPDSDEPLTGPPSPTLGSQPLISVQSAQQGKSGSLVEQWFDGTSYLTGFAATKGCDQYPGLGWIVLVRQSAKEAFAEAVALQEQIIIWGIALGVTSGALVWWIAGWLINPVLQIAAAADSIRQGDTTARIPVFSGRDEVAKLSRAVNSLFISLEEQKQLLMAFNAELDQKVKERTARLNSLNEQLMAEISDRKQAEVALQQANQELHRLTIVDGLTGMANRRHVDQHLVQEWQRSIREQLPLSLILLDVDYFKRYNDFYGHLAGDHCLQRIARVLSSQVQRSHDLAARYGGEEFIVVLPNTELEGAIHLAETIRQAVKSLQIPHANSPASPYVTLSLGVATGFPAPGSSPSALIESTDQQLYRAKALGRDRVMSHSPDSTSSSDH
ncbi:MULTISPECIES: diguanylate cyclase [unclassified Leptolyngbya]|uniref:diguanylate cyclase domain-containing protein n=1 Tax=unclassified Leptolyngbya TaxID=2650499 RepID=UPI001687250B|nr:MULTISPECIES: diguanylate cyclase [unclassified Leptolyngbya]MBD1914153.1 diguanylate cyclase [Leptolyngbya sp. FACHB-8]MBD2157461.1 diguanylate cyclase [Leptolyngbya sp. FACHB-16]